MKKRNDAVAMKKGQVSTEILMLIGLLLLLMLPVLMYADGRAGVTGEDMTVQRAEFVVQRLSSSVDSVGYLGGAAGLVEEIEIPSNFKNLTVNGRDVIITIDSSAGKKQIVKGTGFRIKSVGLGNISKAGTYFIEITALSNFTALNAEQVQMELK